MAEDNIGTRNERDRHELAELVAIARALSSERNLHKLLELILQKSRDVTAADAGSIYIVESQGLAERERTLHFMVSQNDSVQMDLREFTLPVDERSIVGRAVLSGTLINIPDLYQLEEPGKNPWGFQHHRHFDRKSGYQGRSMLTVPMINQHEEVIGVIQLINRKRSRASRLVAPEDFASSVIPFDARSEELAAAVAGQAGISLENARLSDEIRRLFEGFVNAAVTAIEARDPTTSGHSQRVALLTVGLAEQVARAAEGPFKEVQFSADEMQQLEYAALLHDFGKVGVREQVLVKAKKLYEHQRLLLLERFDYIHKANEAELWRRKLELAAREGWQEAERRFPELEEETERLRARLEQDRALVLDANEPTVVARGGFEKLQDIAALTFVDARGQMRPYLTQEEVSALSLQRGTLTQEERLQIESHVVHTYNFLENIPWGRRLGRLPTIAGSHHERLDGTGYPRGLRGDQICIEARMMMIADVFDALTASDRPYKKAMPPARALDILAAEVKAGKADAELFRLFTESGVWRQVVAG